LYNVIPRVETIYYEPVTAYDLEFEQNEAKRNIYLIEKSYVNQIMNDLTEVMR